MTQTHQLRPDGGEDDRTRHEVVFETAPTIRPVLVWFAVVFVIGAVVLSWLVASPEAFGDRQLTEIVFWVVFLVVAAFLLRYVWRMFVLTRTRYVVTNDDIRREFELLYRRHARELPMEKIRGMDFNQGRIQSVLGYGTLSFLAGGTNQSLGFVEFEHLVHPHETRDRLRELISKRTD